MRGVHSMHWVQDGVRYTRECLSATRIRCCASATGQKKMGALQLNVRYDRGYIFEGMIPDPRRPGQMIRAGGWGSMF